MNSLSYLNHLPHFPDPQQALDEPNGLLAIGGDLSPQRLVEAYYQGIFPWFNDDDPILWWSPEPRAIFKPKVQPLNKSMKKYLRKTQWRYTINHAFADVIKACSEPRLTQQGTWISSDIQEAYIQLHRLGKAHSIEVWDGNELIGGLYGIAVGSVFCGESMFHRQTNASKAAFAMLNQHISRYGFKLIDAQIMNPHLENLGAQACPREDFLLSLRQLRNSVIDNNAWIAQEVCFEF
ncbi:leucyl/phenylalanyl-tRNA--protein transferase [Shewanella sp. 1_MG-2023]|uniref:Leucyl/phenylalanyl-tRNA--protein transferase n=1 Tax=Shewanella electrodiphila TaxID=934143 RepID=A0ABT0KMX0_9GAMM|nr:MULTISPECIES: leucyl/phenylalanyl-tRNA--protein transferase [unclassified Shewanella]MCL1045195.1 leucyl/phenylalanyl-tRNA--protein transferase [Shewanella electrodiphila]MCC4833383.1 leucyl/phenylalanyl-tRNA--protein transferase [Shewanella sp. 10N.7]MDO6611837.1 leucyl/phenylalanyl-tRNA--protein transferase [Shewanella sp. 7_MG-2023]MDO6771692.1 leucyl/phenylalanyl-tRNA--protein transferase [Shewanella sp. 2_MG-2023]MDO6793918.1 leucyl/phenylalanyl-tRNA--protein transferase [Shewanella sp